jgi:hypothetical protein
MLAQKETIKKIKKIRLSEIYFTQTGRETFLCVFFDSFPGHKMRVYLQRAPSILFIWVVTHSKTNRVQLCLTLVIKWEPVCPRWQDIVLEDKL